MGCRCTHAEVGRDDSRLIGILRADWGGAWQYRPEHESEHASSLLTPISPSDHHTTPRLTAVEHV
jgi:hypothetical protein